LAQALDWYLEQQTQNKKGKEQETRRIKGWKARELAKLRLSQLTPMHFVEFRRQREADGRAGNTIRLDLSLISDLFKTARLDWGMPYLENPIALLRKPRQGKGRDRRLSADEAKRFERALEACPKKLVRLAVLFAIHTAARQGEILRLKRTDVDFGRRIAIFRDTKNGEDRAVPLSKHALAVLSQIEASEGPYMFPVTRTVITRAWRHILERARIRDFRFHDLRHEATSSLFERGLSTMEVQKMTGHKTLSMLLRYTHMDVRHVVQRFDETEEKPARPTDSPKHSIEVVRRNGTLARLDETVLRSCAVLSRNIWNRPPISATTPALPARLPSTFPVGTFDPKRYDAVKRTETPT